VGTYFKRFRSEAVETNSYFLTVLRYIHQNPIKAKIVGDLADYRWSSYSEYLWGGGIVDKDKEYALNIFSAKSDEAIERFKLFLGEANQDVCLEILDSKVSVGDEDLCQIIKQQFGIEAIEIGNESREKQGHILRVIKEIDGSNIRQIARVTGLSPTRIWKA